MNSSEGLRRIATVIRYCGYGIAVVCIGMGFGNADFDSARDAWGLIALGFGFAAFFALGGKALAWIIDGFAKPKSSG